MPRDGVRTVIEEQKSGLNVTHSIKAASASGTGGMLNERDERECSGGIKGKCMNDDWLLCYGIVNLVKGMR